MYISGSVQWKRSDRDEDVLERGAKQAVLVEQNRKAVDCINRNLEFTGLKDKARVITETAAIDSLEQ